MYGIPNELVEAIEDMYQDTTAKVLSPDGETKPFKILSGVLQGDTLAPYLFIIVLDYTLRKAIDGREEELSFCLKKHQSRRVGPEILTDLDFADDIALLSEQIQQAQNLLNNVEVQCGKIGLKINAKKHPEHQSQHKEQEGCSVESLQQTQEHLESTTRKILQIETFLGRSGICTTVWFRGLDTHQNPGKTNRWLLYMPPVHCLKCQLGTAYDQ